MEPLTISIAERPPTECVPPCSATTGTNPTHSSAGNARRPCFAALIQFDRCCGVSSWGGRDLYVGRTNDIRGRYGRHCNGGATHRMASFAFRLAREATGRVKPTYRAGEGSRQALMDDPTCASAFAAAKARIRVMDFRWVEETDPVRQCLLEVYCAVALRTPYNDFDNH